MHVAAGARRLGGRRGRVGEGDARGLGRKKGGSGGEAAHLHPVAVAVVAGRLGLLRCSGSASSPGVDQFLVTVSLSLSLRLFLTIFLLRPVVCLCGDPFSWIGCQSAASAGIDPFFNRSDSTHPSIHLSVTYSNLVI